MKKLLSSCFNFCLVFLCVSLASCSDDEPMIQNMKIDTYQESKRSYKDGEVSYEFAEYVKMFSEYQMNKFVELRNDSVLLFSKDIQIDQLPKVGDIYVYNEISDKFPNAFVGKIESIYDNGGQYEVTASYVPIDTIYTSLQINKNFDISTCKIYDENGEEIQTTTVAVDSNEDSILISSDSDTLLNNVQQHNSRGVSVIEQKKMELTFIDLPNIKSKGEISIGGYLDVDFNLITGHAVLEAFIKGDLKGLIDLEVEEKVEFEDTKKLICEIPVRCPQVPILKIPLRFYEYTTSDANVKLSAEFGVSISPKLRLELKDDQFSGSYSLSSSKKFFDADGKFSVSGQLGVGIGLRSFLGFGLAQWTMTEIRSAYVDGKIDIEANSSFDIVNSSDGLQTDLTYQALHNAEFKVKGTVGAYAERKGFLKLFGKKSAGIKNEYVGKRTIEVSFETFYLLPRVSAWSVKKGGDYADVTYVLSGNLLFPVNYGMLLYRDGVNIGNAYSTDGLQLNLASTKRTFTFASLDKGATYTVYPVFKFFGLGSGIKSDEGKTFTMNGEDEEENPDEDDSEITPGQEVDLGLSVNWGGWNVGASSPEQYGGYYAWGETEEKSDYTWETYKYWVDSDGDGSVESNEITNIGTNISGTQYDVARQKWGGSWRMPTKAEIDELISKCTWTWYQYKGVWGQKVTGPNGNSIFLPAAGGRGGTSLYDDGSYGGYWSATLDEGYYYGAWYLIFGDGGFNSDGSCSRDDGLSVRPVK